MCGGGETFLPVFFFKTLTNPELYRPVFRIRIGFSADPDPAFYLNGSQTNADPDPGQTLLSQKVGFDMTNILYVGNTYVVKNTYVP